MKVKANKLFAVRDRTHTGCLLKPDRFSIFGTDRTLRRIVLAPSPEEALLLTYPNAHTHVWNIAQLRVYSIVPENRFPIRTPAFLEKAFEIPHAMEWNEHACFSQLRMQEEGVFKVIKNSKLNTEIIDGDGSLLGVKYALI